MAGDSADWIERIKGAERERSVIELGLEALDERLRADPSVLRNANLEASDLTATRRNLDRTFLFRLVTEFEGALRDYWRNDIGRRTRPDLRPLIDAVASRRGVSSAIREEVHRVREWRNAVVHHDAGGVAPVPLPEARRALCRFAAHLPPRW